MRPLSPRTAGAAVVLALALSLLPRSSAADSNADEADARFRRATQLYKERRYDEALTEYFASNRLVKNRNVVFNIARCFEALGHFEEAYRYYAEFRASEPGAAERGALDKKLAELAPRVALLKISSNPPGATVYIDRKDLGGRGETPLLLPFAAGKHPVIVELRGHHPASTDVELTLGAVAEASVDLRPITGTVQIKSTPSAEVYVDRAVGDTRPAVSKTTPAEVQLPPGRHTVELVAQGYILQRTDVVVRADETTKIDVALERRPPPSGTVVLRANVVGALVRVDGKARGFAPVVLSLRTGKHRVEVSSPGHDVWSKEIGVEKESSAFYEVELVESEAEVVGATRSTQTLSRAPAAVTLIDRAELRAFGYRTLAEALSAVRGLYFSDDLNYEAVGIRGFSRPGDYTNRILVTRDGHTINDDWIGSTAVGRDFSPDLEDVARIEVVRGPGSTFYGAGAFFGVVNVVSLDPATGPAVRAGGELDSSGGGTAFVRGRATGDLGSVSLYASAFDTDGRIFEFPEYRDTPSEGFARHADAENAQRASVRATIGPIALHGGYSRRSKDVPTAQYETVFNPAYNEATDFVVSNTIDRRGYAEGSYSRNVGPAGLNLRLAYDRQDYNGIFPYDDGAGEAFLFADEGGGQWVTGEGRVSFAAPGQNVTIGAEGVSHRIHQSFDEDNDGADDFTDKHNYLSGSLYVVDRAEIGERLDLTGGLRLDRFGPQKDVALSPRLAVVARPYDGGATKLFGGRSFRSPSVFELFYNDGGITQVAPESLDPETIWSAELEHVHTFGRQSYLLGSVFANRLDNLIIDPEDPDDLIDLANSPDEVYAFGSELEGRVRSRAGAWVSASISATKVVTDEDSARINSAPIVSAVRAFWPVSEDLSIAGQTIYNSRRRQIDGERTDHAFIASLYGTHKLGTTDLLLRAGVINLFDVTWQASVGGEFLQTSIPQRGRTFSLQLVYEPK